MCEYVSTFRCVKNSPKHELAGSALALNYVILFEQRSVESFGAACSLALNINYNFLCIIPALLGRKSFHKSGRFLPFYSNPHSF